MTLPSFSDNEVAYLPHFVLFHSGFLRRAMRPFSQGALLRPSGKDVTIIDRIAYLLDKICTQGGNARYRIRAIYKSEEGCPPSVYKCTKPRTGRNLVWTKQESDTFKGEEGFHKVTSFMNLSTRMPGARPQL